MKNINRYPSFIPKLAILLAFMGLLSTVATAQLKPIAAQYFQNPYLQNPSSAVAEDGLVLNLSYSFQSENVQLGSSVQGFTATYKKNKSGLGLTFINDENGLLSTKRVKFTYAYQVNLSDKTKMNFGISPGFRQERFDFGSAIANDSDDPFPAEFNSRKAVFDVDFGGAITHEKFTLQGSVQNIKQTLKRAENDVFTQFIYLEASYRLQFGSKANGFGIQPLLAYSGILSAKNRKDYGMRISLMEDQISALAVFHSDRSFTSGVNVVLKQGFTIQGAYNSASSIYNTQNPGTLELAIKTNLSKK